MTKRERLLISLRSFHLQQVKTKLATPDEAKRIQALSKRIKSKSNGTTESSNETTIKIQFEKDPFHGAGYDCDYRGGAT